MSDSKKELSVVDTFTQLNGLDFFSIHWLPPLLLFTAYGHHRTPMVTVLGFFRGSQAS
jgi:hypothetical protein